MNPYRIDLIAGARPNFMKIGPIFQALSAYAGEIEARIIHTGQHYDRNMSQIFFQQLGLPEPHISLEVGSGSHAHQTARIMTAYEDLIQPDRPAPGLGVGGGNSTLACALVGATLPAPALCGRGRR